MCACRFWPFRVPTTSPPSEATARDPRRATIVMHVPKTSGLAMRDGLAEALAPCRTLWGMDRCLFGAFDSFDSMAPDVRSTIYLEPANLPRDVDLVVGHMALSTLQSVYAGGQFVSILREPQSRILSHWVYWRAHTDQLLAPWGDWAAFVRRARDPLAAFLAEPELACQTDNLLVRMLLLPEPLIPRDGFIAPEFDTWLLDAAMQRLAAFSFLDILEDPGLEAALGGWLGRPLRYRHVNETPAVPDAFRSPLHQELTNGALELLAARSRLDHQLWEAVARQRLPHVSQDTLRLQTLLRTVARHSRLLA